MPGIWSNPTVNGIMRIPTGEMPSSLGDDDAPTPGKGKKRPSVNYDYLLVTTQQLLRYPYHRQPSLPDCTAMKDKSYYCGENAYLDTVDEDKLASAPSPGAMKKLNKREMVTLKCANADIYRQMETVALDDPGNFTYLKNGGSSAAYVTPGTIHSQLLAGITVRK